jgi:hypothetical protein
LCYSAPNEAHSPWWRWKGIYSIDYLRIRVTIDSNWCSCISWYFTTRINLSSSVSWNNQQECFLRL